MYEVGGVDLPPHAAPQRRSRWAPWRKLAIGFFFAAVALLLVWQARRIDWAAVGQALRSYDAATLAGALALVACSHLLYSTFDLIGRHEVGHRLPAAQVMRVAAISYAFNLNLGTLLGAVGMRVRQYTRLGLQTADIARIVALSVVTNWSGYLVLGGAAFALRGVDLPDHWRFTEAGLQAAGCALLLLAAGYLLSCRLARGRVWLLRGHAVRLPGAGVAAVQIALSAANWAVMAATVTLLLQPQAAQPPGYGAVLVTLLLGCVAGVVAKVPAGLGVLEAVFIALLGGRVSAHGLLAALLTYRALYYLLPLALAAAATLVLEARARRSAAKTAPATPAAGAATAR